MNILGISAGFHDAAATVIDGTNGDILFAGHSERFSRIKHDPVLSPKLIDYALSFGTMHTLAYYENHWLKKFRQLVAGQKLDDWHWSLRNELVHHLPERPVFLKEVGKVVGYSHHRSHAAAGFQTSPFDQATVVVIDAVGELDTISIWNAYYDKKGYAKYKLRWRCAYPHSIGLFYSAMTNHAGLKPLDEEVVLMGMSALGDYTKTVDKIKHKLIKSIFPPSFKETMHIGIDDSFAKAGTTMFDVAAGAQYILEEMIEGAMLKSKKYDYSNNLVFMGGVALNCLANRNLGKWYKNIWIMPNPDDAGSSLGAAALAYGKKINWVNSFLGYNIEGEYPVIEVVDYLLEHQLVGVANGKAEFGPRSLGNRSLFADPRDPTIKDTINSFKYRHMYRPFAPMILEEYTADYFDMPVGFEKSEYMQVVAPCKKAKQFPAIVHVDGTSRVQTVPIGDTGVRKMLELWHSRTGCPMLLNTSLNISGEPKVNDEIDARRFEDAYNVKVFTKAG